MAALREPDALAPAGGEAIAPAIVLGLCIVCGVNPKAAQGRLSRCLPCIRQAAEQNRQARIAAEAALAAKRTTKVCSSCKRTKAMADFSPHRLAKDGRRKDCRQCVAADRVKRKQRTDAQKARAKELAQQPHRKIANLLSVLQWQARNGEAIEAQRAVDRAIRAGEIVPAKSCQAAGCKRRSGLASHHNSYAANRRKRVVWLCNQHHRITHSGRNVPLKRTAPVKFARAPQAA
jgi:hypothetical protein